jgi:hypothetical protein
MVLDLITLTIILELRWDVFSQCNVQHVVIAGGVQSLRRHKIVRTEDPQSYLISNLFKILSVENITIPVDMYID